MTRLSEKEFKKIFGNNLKLSNKKGNGVDEKYKSNSIKYGDIRFRSKIEYDRYKFLELMKKIGKIKDFEYESDKFVLQEAFKINNISYRKITYTPDFKIILNNGDIWYEDTKSEITRKKDSYRIKMKLFIHKYILNGEIKGFKEILKSNEIYWK